MLRSFGETDTVQYMDIFYKIYHNIIILNHFHISHHVSHVDHFVPSFFGQGRPVTSVIYMRPAWNIAFVVPDLPVLVLSSTNSAVLI